MMTAALDFEMESKCCISSGLVTNVYVVGDGACKSPADGIVVHSW